ncbi:FAD-dependent oxidoreductase [Maribellus luteus]|uniref:FAD-dependent oxidoreductase n=1 Tax=Maribellus luteus TaxID=2305463 RepID=UPI00138FF8D5|nr:FAD-dependent oxidoreductase [Maribellus luteus]
MNNKHVAVIGGGIAGMEAASVLARQGLKVTLIEKQANTGGKLNDWDHLFPDFSSPEVLVNSLATKTKDSGVNTVYNTEISRIERAGKRFELRANQDARFYADAVLVASGFNVFDATIKEEYGYGLFGNVITSVDFEKRMKKHGQLHTIQGTDPKRVAIIHCVGSRDAKVGNTYCSKVCCITGIKQAIEISEMLPDCEVFCFYMDLRLYGSKFDSLYLQAQKRHKIQFIRGRLSEAAERADKSIQIKAEDTLQGRPLRMTVDMVILLVGMEPGASTSQLIQKNQMTVDENGFLKSANVHCARNQSTQEGIFMAGTAICPMAVNETIENARSATTEIIHFFENRRP